MLPGDLVTPEAARGLPEGAEIVDPVGFRYVADGQGGCAYPLLGMVYDGEDLVSEDGPFTLVGLPQDAILR